MFLYEQTKTAKTSFREAQADKYLLFAKGAIICESYRNLGRLVRNKSFAAEVEVILKFITVQI